LLHHGKALILLDGLDEVQEKDSSEVLKQVCKLSEEYYKNQLIITCRIASYQLEDSLILRLSILTSQIEAFTKSGLSPLAGIPERKG